MHLDRSANARHQLHAAPAWRLKNNQRGIIVFFTLIAVVILLIASIALVRSFDTALGISGNIGFKRDLVNQSERGVTKAASLFAAAGVLNSATSRTSDSLADNYSATALTSAQYGVPDILLNDTLWTAKGMTAGDITDPTTGITVRYVVDRLCRSLTSAEASAPAGSIKLGAYCMLSGQGEVKGGTVQIQRPGGPSPIVYRISLRVTGPRNTQTFIQQSISL